VISNYLYRLNRRMLASPPVCRNTLIYAQMNSHTVLTCRIGLDWVVLPFGEVSKLVVIILIYQT